MEYTNEQVKDIATELISELERNMSSDKATNIVNRLTSGELLALYTLLDTHVPDLAVELIVGERVSLNDDGHVSAIVLEDVLDIETAYLLPYLETIYIPDDEEIDLYIDIISNILPYVRTIYIYTNPQRIPSIKDLYAVYDRELYTIYSDRDIVVYYVVDE